MTRPKITNRSAWHKTKNGTWTCSIGERGTRIRLFEMTKGGMYYRDTWNGRSKDRRSLGTHDRDTAYKLGHRLLNELLNGKAEAAVGIVRLGALWERFRRESAAWLDNLERSRKDDERSAKVLVGFFGSNRDISSLDPGNIAAFQKARLAGGISLSDGEVTGPTRARTGQADLKFLRTMLRWATTVRVGGGKRLLASNPLDGIAFASERNERRPIATIERFLETRKAIQAFLDDSDSDASRRRWQKLDMALVLAEVTGRRLSSILALAWEDIDFKHETIRWRAEADKKGKEWVIPMPTSLAEELKAQRKRLGAIAGYLFPAEKDSSRPMSRHDLSWWLRKAEVAAGLPKLQGGLWHPFRRKWATERKKYPIKDLMEAGGWSDAATVVKSYQQPDRDTLLQVMSEPGKFTDLSNSTVSRVVRNG